MVMGIVNVTPDSFSGDGLAHDPKRAMAQAVAMVDAGAEIVDVGGESTRPHSQPISIDEELERILPVVEKLTAQLDVPVSIDTRKAAVAQAAVRAGASIVNDIWGLRGDPAMVRVVAENDVALVAMHNQHDTVYDDVVGDVYSSLEETLRIARTHGIDEQRIIVDPGIGFGKTPAQNLEVLRNVGALLSLGHPILVGPSRKSTIGLLLDGEPPQRRLEGSLALAVLAAAAGADIVRVHDVAQTVRALRVTDAVIRGTPLHLQHLAAPGPTG